MVLLSTLLLLTGTSPAATAGPALPPGAEALAGFGRTVVVSGDMAFVGEPGGGRGGGPAGVVHLYRHLPTGWKQIGTLTSPSGGPDDGFGASLAVDGALLLVGQYHPAPPAGRGGGGRGAAAAPTAPEMVHLFRRGADGKWKAAGTLASPFAPGAEFGAALAVRGDLTMVGAPAEPTGGVVTVFRQASGGTWAAAGVLPGSGLAAGDQFGAALSLDGDRVAVGAPGREGHGEVRLFLRASNGSWAADGSPLAARRAPDNALFGTSVLLRGDRLMVGAPGAVFAAAVSAAPAGRAGAPAAAPAAGGRGRGGFGGGMGMVVQFDRNPASGSWSEGSMLTPFDFPANARFGSTMAMAGEELWIGAPMADGAGRIYVARKGSDGSFNGVVKLMVNAGMPASGGGRGGAQFAATFGVSGGNAVVGMPGDASGLGTIAFLARNATGTWVSRGTDFPAVADRFAAVTGKEVICGTNGMASAFQCANTGLLAFLPIQQLGGDRTSHMNDNWGWTDPVTGHEYALAGRTDGTAFVDITDPEHPRYLGSLPKTPGVPSGVWRDIKTYKNFAYIVADGSGAHGMQVFDLTRLRNVKVPQTFTPDTTYHEINSAHNIVINENTGYAYAVGASAGGTTCGGGLHMIDIRDPRHPAFAGCFGDARTGRSKTGYSHDAQCVTYKGPDTRYTGHEICIGANETAVSIADVTDKAKPVALSFISYPNVSYAHQGWFTEDQRYFYLDDESDEIAAQADTTGLNHARQGTRTMIYDFAKLDDPVLAKEYFGPVHSSDHNLYVKGNKLYEANYGSGLRIIDISDPLNPHEVGYLDTYPDDDNSPVMHGAWSTYPFFKSGTILVTSVTEGLFLVKDRSRTVVP